VLSDGEEIMMLAFFILIQYWRVTDGQTDRQTDRRTDGHLCCGYTSACIACHATALVKIYQENVAWTKSLCKSLLLLLKYWGTFPCPNIGGCVGVPVSYRDRLTCLHRHAILPILSEHLVARRFPIRHYIFRSRSQGSISNVG